MYSLSRMSAVPATVRVSAETANMSARRLKLSVKQRICTFPRGVSGGGPMALQIRKTTEIPVVLSFFFFRVFFVFGTR